MIIPLFIEQTRHLVIWLVLIHNIANAVVFPFADPLGKGLRATGCTIYHGYFPFYNHWRAIRFICTPWYLVQSWRNRNCSGYAS